MTERVATGVAKAIMAVPTMAIRGGEAIEGNLPVEEANRRTGSTRGKTTLSGHTVETSILPVAALQPTARKNTVVVRSWLGA